MPNAESFPIPKGKRARLARAWGLLLLATLAGGGCGDEQPLTYRLVFPHENAFLLAQLASVTVYDAAEVNPDQVCRALSVGQAADAQSLQSTGDQNVCEFNVQDSDVTKLSNMGFGRLVFFAKVTDRNGDALMRGCTVADVTDETERVDIQLATLPQYPSEDPSTILDPACTTVQQKCANPNLICDTRD